LRGRGKVPKVSSAGVSAQERTGHHERTRQPCARSEAEPRGSEARPR
jgi:hypothetical protein